MEFPDRFYDKYHVLFMQYYESAMINKIILSQNFTQFKAVPIQKLHKKTKTLSKTEFPFWSKYTKIPFVIFVIYSY